ncbi:MAG: type III pantothenate kinase [Candidatus Aureabacteria bacterium]|nr:type III pantothenate kinase [Candidatus Auribacterota bacterium]
MKQVLFIDAGNRRIKYAVRKKNSLVFHVASSIPCFLNQMRALKKPFSCCVYSSVLSVRETAKLIKGIQSECDRIYPLKDLATGLLKTSYDMNKLGDDRLASLLACYFNKWGSCVIIDAGTAVTIDFFKGPDVFYGGFICSGFSTELEALSDKTGRLPLLKPRMVRTRNIPRNTEQALLQGVINTRALGIRALIGKTLAEKKRDDENWKYILTGADAKFLRAYFPEAFLVRNLVIEGMDMVYLNILKAGG